MQRPGQLILNQWLELGNKALIGRIMDRGIVELDKKSLPSSKKTRKSNPVQELEANYEYLKTQMKESHQNYLEEWQQLNPQEQITPERMSIIQEIFDIFLQVYPTKQMSESAIVWITKYALETTRTSP